MTLNEIEQKIRETLDSMSKNPGAAIKELIALKEEAGNIKPTSAEDKKAEYISYWITQIVNRHKGVPPTSGSTEPANLQTAIVGLRQVIVQKSGSAYDSTGTIGKELKAKEAEQAAQMLNFIEKIEQALWNTGAQRERDAQRIVSNLQGLDKQMISSAIAKRIYQPVIDAILNFRRSVANKENGETAISTLEGAIATSRGKLSTVERITTPTRSATSSGDQKSVDLPSAAVSKPKEIKENDVRWVETEKNLRSILENMKICFPKTGKKSIGEAEQLFQSKDKDKLKAFCDHFKKVLGKKKLAAAGKTEKHPHYVYYKKISDALNESDSQRSLVMLENVRNELVAAAADKQLAAVNKDEGAGSLFRFRH